MPKTTHGHTIGGHSREYSAWANMISRCTQESDASYLKYGARGIKVCESWRAFDRFLQDMGLCPAGYSLDRIDNDGDYGPSNCRWADRKTQQRNTSRNRWLTVDGVGRTVAEWSEISGTNRKTILKRLQLGWSSTAAVRGRDA